MFVAVAGLHVLAGLLFFATSFIRIGRSNAADTPLSLLWLSREDPPRLPLTSSAPNAERSVKRPQTSRDVDRPPGAVEPEPSDAITLPMDVRNAADAAARRQAVKEENERRWRNLAGPSESQLERSRNNVPLVRDYHRFGDGERAEGGELIAWVNDKCYFTTHGISTFGLPQTSQVCKDPPKPETELFKDMRRKLDQGAKGPAP